jgi:hypothetical protein
VPDIVSFKKGLMGLVMFVLCAPGFSPEALALSFDEAMSIAIDQQANFQEEFEGRGDFIGCVMEAYELAEKKCSRYDGIDDFEPAVLEFNSKGKIIRVYSLLESHFEICMSYELMKNSCSNPPLKNLFGIIETR